MSTAGDHPKGFTFPQKVKGRELLENRKASMTLQDVWFYPTETFSFVDSNLNHNINISTGKSGYKLTTADSAKPQNFLVNDSGSGNDADILNDRLTWFGGVSNQQTLVEDTIINGSTYSAGTSVGLGYKIEVTADNGAVVTLASVVLNGNVVGFVATSPLEGETTYTVTRAGASLDNANVAYGDMAYCFVRGTLIHTNRGDVVIENLTAGDLVLTVDNGFQPIRWIGRQTLPREALGANKNLCPIRIREGMLGGGVPSPDLLVSPQHRVLVRSKIAQKMFGANEVLVAAKQLCQIDGIDIADDMTEVEYFHMLFDQHEVVISNGALTESLYTGPEALKSVGAAAREEIFAIFPDLRSKSYEPLAARRIASGRMGRKLAMRHIQNHKPLIN